MAMIAVYFVILYTFTMRYAKGDQLNLEVSGGQSKWKEAFDSCNDPTYWHQLSNYCQPDSCNVSKFTDTIINKQKIGRQQYWIYGYVLRSPVIVNIGCYSLDASVKNVFHRGIFSFAQNSAFECSMACSNDSVEYICLKGSECLCIPKKLNGTLTKNIVLQEQENTSICNQPCAGNNGDLCGGPSVVDGKLLYSVFQVLQRSISVNKVGSTCAQLSFDANKQQRFHYTTCNANKMSICERYNKSGQTYKDICRYKAVSWYAAQQNCQERGLQLRSYTSPSFSSKSCALKGQRFWIGNHIAEKIVWANASLPRDTLCLKLVITDSGSVFETENCNTSLYSLCYKQDHTSTGKNDETHTTPTTQYYSSTGRTTYESAINTMSDLAEENTNVFGRTTLRGPVNAEYDSDEDKPDFIPIIAGSVGGFVALVIAVITVCIIQRRKKCNNKHVTTAVDQGEPDTYSEPIKNTVSEESRKLVIHNTIPEENSKLVNVTEEGIYNHLGDSEKMIEMKPQDSSIYDITGDDEYHVFTGNAKQTIKDDDDLYDHGAASDVYNTLNDTVTPNRPESDTYNVINAK